MKKVVFLMGGYYPNFSAGGVCLGNIIDEIDKDYEVIVIAIDYTTNLMKYENYRNHKIVRIHTLIHKLEIFTINLEKSQYIYQRICGNFFHLILKGYKLLSILLKKNTIDKKLYKKYLEALKNIEKVNYIIPTCAPFESILASMKYVQINKNCEMIPILFDGYANAKKLHRTNFNYKIKYNNHINLEKDMFNKSKAVLYTESWAKHIKNHFFIYRNKCIEIEHPMLKNNLEDYNAINEELGYKAVISYIGSLNFNNRNPQGFLKIIEDAIFNNFNFIFCGAGDAFKLIKSTNTVQNKGRIPKEEANYIVSKSTYLLSIGNIDITQTPSKIFEMISTGKPIIHYYFSKYDPVLNILEQYPNKCLLDDKNDLEDNRIKLYSFLIKKCALVNFEEIKKIYWKALPSTSANILKKIMED